MAVQEGSRGEEVRQSRVVMAALLGVGLLPGSIGAWAAWTEHQRIETWQAVPARVLVSEVRTRALLRYRYESDAGRLESERVYPGPIASTAGETDELVARYPVGTATTAWHDPYDPSRAFLVPAHGFLPYLILLGASPIFALAASMAAGALRAGGPDVAPLRKAGGGWREVSVVRPSRVLRNGAAGALAVFGVFGIVVFGTYLSIHAQAPSALAVLAFLAWLALMAWFARVVVARTLTAAILEEARAYVRPESPGAGTPFAVRVEQRSRGSAVAIKGITVTLIGDRSTPRLLGGRVRTKTERVFREKAQAVPAGRLSPDEDTVGECAFNVPSRAFDEKGQLRFRMEVRTRLLGPDYCAGFPLPRK